MPDWNAVGVRMAFPRPESWRDPGKHMDAPACPKAAAPSVLPGDAAPRATCVSCVFFPLDPCGSVWGSRIVLLASLQGSGSRSEVSGGPRCCCVLGVTGGFALSGLCSPLWVPGCSPEWQCCCWAHSEFAAGHSPALSFPLLFPDWAVCPERD